MQLVERIDDGRRGDAADDDLFNLFIDFYENGAIGNGNTRKSKRRRKRRSVVDVDSDLDAAGELRRRLLRRHRRKWLRKEESDLKEPMLEMEWPTSDRVKEDEKPSYKVSAI